MIPVFYKIYWFYQSQVKNKMWTRQNFKFSVDFMTQRLFLRAYYTLYYAI